MTTMQLHYAEANPHHRGRSAFLALSLAALVLAIAVALIQDLPHVDAPLSSHAVLQHGQDAEQAKQCLQGGQGYLFFNPMTQRWGLVCWLGDRWGIVILTAAWVVITAFVTKCKNAPGYMKRQGYEER